MMPYMAKVVTSIREIIDAQQQLNEYLESSSGVMDQDVADVAWDICADISETFSSLLDRLKSSGILEQL